MKLLRLIWMLALLPILTAQAQDTCGDAPARRTRYELTATLNWASKVVSVEQTVHYYNDHELPLTELVFHAEPNRLSRQNVMNFKGALDIDGITNERLRLAVPLPTPVAPGCDATVTLQYDINVLPLGDENPLGWLAYTERQLNLGHWFPTIALYQDGGWFTNALHYIGEQSVPEAADYHLDFTVSNAPAGLQLMAPGQVAAVGANRWTVDHSGARDLALSLSAGMSVMTETAAGVEVQLYVFDSTAGAAVAQAMNDATAALEAFSATYGPYPYDRLVMVEGDFPDGYEFSGLVFVSQRWFEIWNGTPLHWLSVITVHEIAHQWWYLRVASNQALHPYLDEALATYSELVFYEHAHPDLADDWWAFRVDPYTTSDPVDVTVHEYTQWRPYINAVYMNGVRMLRDLRAELGDEAFFGWLRAYGAANEGGIATPVDFWGALPDYEATAPIRTRWLRDSDPLR